MSHSQVCSIIRKYLACHNNDVQVRKQLLPRTRWTRIGYSSMQLPASLLIALPVAHCRGSYITIVHTIVHSRYSCYHIYIYTMTKSALSSCQTWLLCSENLPLRSCEKHIRENMAPSNAPTCLLFFITVVTATFAKAIDKRELPLSYSCDPRTDGSCYKGDLVSTSVADCEKDYDSWWKAIFTCFPINDYTLSSVVDIPDVSKNGIDCVPVTGDVPFTCGSEYDTRCVCDKTVDYKKLSETSAKCRCQYWPVIDARMNHFSFCTQYDHGGTSGIHFYTCCDNCDDEDTSCDGHTYHGGGSTDDYCSTCGQHSTLGGGRVTYRFNCVSCNQQQRCEEECDRNWVSKNIPGLCPDWAGCFRECCIKAAKSSQEEEDAKGSDESNEFCGDSICQAGEDSSTCPADCPSINPNPWRNLQ